MKRTSLLFLFIIGFTTLEVQAQINSADYANSQRSPSLNLGDAAPPFRVREWLKGESIDRFEKGKIYVIEFWATWCKPCKAAIPRLSALAAEYKESVTVLGIDVYEKKIKKAASIEKIKAFVDSMGHQMDYRVAAQDSNFMETDWLVASREEGIPQTFVVNAEGKLAWIGHPKDLAEVLPKIVNNSWDVNEALTNRNLQRHLENLDDSMIYELINYGPQMTGAPAKPDSALLIINDIVRKEPKLKYAPIIGGQTFSLLLQTNPHKAYEFGKAGLLTSFNGDPFCRFIIGDIDWYSEKLKLSTEIYRLGAEACQVYIDQFPYPEIFDSYKYYTKMAAWCWRANDKSKAIIAQQKAIESLKSKKDFSVNELSALELQLQKYKSISVVDN